MELRRGSWVVAAVTLVTVACGQDADDKKSSETVPVAQSTPASDSLTGMPGMGGMSGMQMGGDMMTRMHGMMTMQGDSMMKMMPEHTKMLGDMMTQMDREMQAMGMAADPKWTALSDSLHDDQARMPTMSAAEMKAFMTEHQGRAERLMEMHRGMMGGK